MKKIPQQFPLVLRKIKEADLTEGNLYLNETTFLQLHVCVSESFRTKQQKEQFRQIFLDKDQSDFNDMMTRIIEGLRGEEIDIVMIELDRVSKEGTPYKMYKPITKK